MAKHSRFGRPFVNNIAAPRTAVPANQINAVITTSIVPTAAVAILETGEVHCEPVH